MLSTIYLFFFFLIYFFSSFHILIMLMLAEFLIIVVVMLLYYISFDWFSFLMVVLIGVCLGSYGISVLVSLSRSKGISYFLYY